MRKYNTEAIVLKSINYQDAHKIYTLMTREKGKISAIARGVRKINSRRGGNLDSINKIVVGISEDDRNFKSITEVKTLNPYINVKSGLENSSHGFYMLELIYTLLEDDHENLEIYNLLEKGLENLNGTLLKNELVIALFELNLMRMLGFEFQTRKCVDCGRKLDNNWKEFKVNYAKGGILCDLCNSHQGFEIHRSTMFLLSRAYLFNWQEIDLPKFKTEDAVKQFAQIARYHLHNSVGDQLRKIKFLL